MRIRFWWHRQHRLWHWEGYLLRVSDKQDRGRGFILLLIQTALVPGSDDGSDGVELASGFATQNGPISCFMLRQMYGARY